MSQLVDWQIYRQQELSIIRGRPLLSPWEPNGLLQPSSLDIRLGSQLRTEHGDAFDIDPVHGFHMEPGRFILGHTIEKIQMPSVLCARVEGKSTVGRHGLGIHVTAGFIDPGFEGQITLELVYHGNVKPFVLWTGMRIAQLTFHHLAGRPNRLYGDEGLGSHYQGQLGATPPAE